VKREDVKRERGEEMNYEEWERMVPGEITGDSLWKMEAYRLGLFAADVGWHDVTKLMQERRTLGLSDQLYRRAGFRQCQSGRGLFARHGQRSRALLRIRPRFGKGESRLVLQGPARVGRDCRPASLEFAYPDHSSALDHDPTAAWPHPA